MDVFECITVKITVPFRGSTTVSGISTGLRFPLGNEKGSLVAVVGSGTDNDLSSGGMTRGTTVLLMTLPCPFLLQTNPVRDVTFQALKYENNK